MIDALPYVFKWSLLGNAIFMLVWMGYRVLLFNGSAVALWWIVLDAGIVIGSVIVADRWREREEEY